MPSCQRARALVLSHSDVLPFLSFPPSFVQQRLSEPTPGPGTHRGVWQHGPQAWQRECVSPVWLTIYPLAHDGVGDGITGGRRGPCPAVRLHRPTFTSS